jgi:hypothetical protein
MRRQACRGEVLLVEDLGKPAPVIRKLPGTEELYVAELSIYNLHPAILAIEGRIGGMAEKNGHRQGSAMIWKSFSWVICTFWA